MKKIKKDFARFLRKNNTEAEGILWGILKNRKFCKFKFRRQHIIEGFAVDFYCVKNKLAIEIDGEIHDKQREYDKERETIIESEDIRIIRFTNDDILNRIDTVLKKLNKELITKIL